MRHQLGLFDQPPATTEIAVVPAARPSAQVDPPKGAAADEIWRDRNWRFGPGREIVYLHPEPTSPAPPAVRGGEWDWNPLVPGWRLSYSRPPFPLTPSGETADRHGPKLLPPAGFLLVDRRRLGGRCPHCSAQSAGYWGGPGWGGWSDARVAAAYESEEAAGRHCYGLTVVDVLGLGAVAPLSHYTRWGAGYCCACGAVSWNDFRDPSSSYYRPPSREGAP
jgi:hypothetical protein